MSQVIAAWAIAHTSAIFTSTLNAPALIHITTTPATDVTNAAHHFRVGSRLFYCVPV